jgi:hypothetical protein
LEELMRQHHISISHQDQHGEFILDLDPEHFEANVSWLWESSWED